MPAGLARVSTEQPCILSVLVDESSPRRCASCANIHQQGTPRLNEICRTAETTILQPGDFYGTVEPVHDAERVRLVTSRHRAGEELPRHVHLSPYLSFVLCGRYDEHAWGADIAREVFTLRFHPAGEEHQDRFGPVGAVCLNIQLLGDWSETIERLALNHGIRTCDAAAPRMLEMFHRYQSWGMDSDLAVEEAVCHFLASCALTERREQVIGASAALRRAIAYVNDTLPDSVTLPIVAAAARVHPAHLARLFQSRLGCTLTGFVRNRRLELAQRTLGGRPEWRLSRIAHDHGFADHAHFTRSFNRDCGMSPSRFRSLIPAE